MTLFLPFVAAAALLAPQQDAAPASTQPLLPAPSVEETGFTAPSDDAGVVEGGVLTRFYHEDGSLAREGYLKDGARIGIWKSWFEDGRRELHGAYKDYKRVGSWILYDETGKSATHAIYSDSGERDGIWQTFVTAQDGTIRLRTSAGWKEGRKHGAHARYTPKGKVLSHTDYLNGRKHGRHLKCSKGAKHKLEEGSYVNGLQSGAWKIYQADGVIRSEGRFEAGRRVGEWIEYHENSRRASVGSFVNGLQDGAWQGFYKQGERRYMGTFAKGFLEGDYVEWWPSGDKKGEGRFQGGKYDGPWKFWDRDGREDASKTGLYRDGDLVR